VLVIVLAALMVSYASSLRAYVNQQQQLASLRAEKQQREQQVAQLTDQIHRWQDPAYIEAQARTRFGWVMPGEVGYVVIDDKGKPVSSKPSSAAQKRNGTPWWQQMWGSVGTADGVAPADNPTPTPTPSPRKTITDTGHAGH
jgi:cell division protein FtsB